MQNTVRPSNDSGGTAQKLTVRPVQRSAAGHADPDLEPGWIFHPSPDGRNQNVLVMLHGYGDTAGKPSLAGCRTCCANRGLQMGLTSAHSQNHDQLDAHLLPCSASCNSLPFGLSADAFAKLGQKLELPQTAILAITGSLPVPGTEKGRAWFHEDRPVSCCVGTLNVKDCLPSTWYQHHCAVCLTQALIDTAGPRHDVPQL